MKNPALCRTAAEILAAALFELYPQVLLLGGKETSTGFFYDFIFPHPIHPQTVALIEERMRQIIRERRPIKTLEMVPFSARELLKRDGHLARAEELADDEGLVELIQIGSFTDLCSVPHLKNTFDLAAFKIEGIESLGEKAIRIRGYAASSKKELKEYLKKLDAYIDHNHMRVGERRGLLTRLEEKPIWLKAGLIKRQKLIEILKEHLPGEEVATYQRTDLEKNHRELANKWSRYPIRVAELGVQLHEEGNWEEGLLQAPEENFYQVTSFYPGEQFEQELISSLQSIGKTLTILDFNYLVHAYARKQGDRRAESYLASIKRAGMLAEMEVREGPAEIAISAEDALGRSWPIVQIAEVKGISTKEKKIGGLVMKVSIERMFALLLEMNGMNAGW